jgi:mevalonate pyrophosphate decarboxylase
MPWLDRIKKEFSQAEFRVPVSDWTEILKKMLRQRLVPTALGLSSSSHAGSATSGSVANKHDLFS